MVGRDSRAGPQHDRREGAPVPAASQDEVPGQTLRSWDAAEAALFPLVMANPLEYQRSLVLVQRLLGWLREQCADVPALLIAASRADALVADARSEQVPKPSDAAHGSLSDSDGDPADLTAGLRLDLIAAAACAMRYRELVAGRAAGRRLSAVAAARASGRAWALIEEVGDERRAPYLPYHRVEAHIPTGRALVISIGPDVTLSRAVMHLDEAELDVVSGALIIGTEIGSYVDPEQFEEALANARQRLS